MSEALTNLTALIEAFTSQSTADRPELRVYTAEELLKLEIPPREPMLVPWLAKSDLGMIVAPRGIGKTMFSLEVAYAVASGGVAFGWQAAQALPIIYIDGEMKAADIVARLKLIMSREDTKPLPTGHFRMLAAALQEQGLPDLADPASHSVYLEHIADAKLVIFDNLATLVRSGKENDAESWAPVQAFLLELRRRGVSVLMVHHTGKQGSQRGTSAREDILDVVIELKKPEGGGGNGARFQVNFTKNRSVTDNLVPSFEAHLDPVTNVWTRAHGVRQGLEDRVIALAALGMTGKQIATEVQTSQATVSRILGRSRQKELPLRRADLQAGNEGGANTSNDEVDDDVF